MSLSTIFQLYHHVSYHKALSGFPELSICILLSVADNCSTLISGRESTSAFGLTELQTHDPSSAVHRSQIISLITKPIGYQSIDHSLHTGNLCLLFCRLLIFFSRLMFSKNSFRNTIRVSNSLDPDQAQCAVRPDLDPNCLQWLSACHTRSERVKLTTP